MAMNCRNSRRRRSTLAELLSQIAKTSEKILIHQIDELRFVNRGITAQTFSAGVFTTLLTKIRGIPLTHCEATWRALFSSFSKSMLLVRSSGKTIGSSFIPG